MSNKGSDQDIPSVVSDLDTPIVTIDHLCDPPTAWQTEQSGEEEMKPASKVNGDRTKLTLWTQSQQKCRNP